MENAGRKTKKRWKIEKNVKDMAFFIPEEKFYNIKSKTNKEKQNLILRHSLQGNYMIWFQSIYYQGGSNPIAISFSPAVSHFSGSRGRR